MPTSEPAGPGEYYLLVAPDGGEPSATCFGQDFGGLLDALREALADPRDGRVLAFRGVHYELLGEAPFHRLLLPSGERLPLFEPPAAPGRSSRDLGPAPPAAGPPGPDPDYEGLTPAPG